MDILQSTVRLSKQRPDVIGVYIYMRIVISLIVVFVVSFLSIFKMVYSGIKTSCLSEENKLLP